MMPSNSSHPDIAVFGQILDATFTVSKRVLTADSPTSAQNATHPYKATPWEDALKPRMPARAEGPLGPNTPNKPAVFLAMLLEAGEKTNATMDASHVRKFFDTVAIARTGSSTTFTKNGVAAVFAQNGGKYSTDFAWVLFQYMRHARYGASNTPDSKRRANNARTEAVVYALELASMVVQWRSTSGSMISDPKEVSTLLWNSLTANLHSRPWHARTNTAVEDTLQKLRSVYSDQEVSEGVKSRLSQAGMSASEMWSSLMVKKIEKLSMLSFLVVINVCFILLLSTRRASLTKHRHYFAGGLVVTISILIARAVLGAVRRSEQFTPEAGRVGALANVETGQHLRAQLDLTENLLDDIQEDVRNRKGAFDRKREAMEHTYVSFRFSERHSNRHIGLMHVLIILSFLIMLVVIMQKSPVQMDRVMLMYGPVVVLGVAVAIVMRRTDQARMRTNWDKIYFPRPE
jgi:hypothetical protein